MIEVSGKVLLSVLVVNENKNLILKNESIKRSLTKTKL